LIVPGNLLVDGEIITKTAFRGFTFNAEAENIPDLAVDAGAY
jgi:hypothetical protein